jgi:hypothetical protein
MLPCRFGRGSQRGVGKPFAARGSGCCTEYGRLLHAKTVHVGTSPPRDLVDYRAAPSVFAPTRVFCGNSAMDSAREPLRLVERGDDAELIEFMHLLRFSILSCDPLVSTVAAGQKRLQLRESTVLLVVAAALPARKRGGGQLRAGTSSARSNIL